MSEVDPLNIRGTTVTLNDTFGSDAFLEIETSPVELKSDEPARDLDTFLFILNDIIRHEEFKENKTQYPIKIVNDFPDSTLFSEILGKEEGVATSSEVGTRYGEILQYTLVRRRPGTIQQTAYPMAPGNMREYSPRYRAEYQDPDNPGYSITVKSQYMDNLIQIVVWARSADTADKRALWLEDLIERYRFYFAKKGFNKIRYEGRSSDRTFTSTGGSQRIVGRPLTFYLRTEKIILVREKELEDIEIALSLTK